MKKIACLILSFMLLVSASYAQKSAILVMLRSEKNRVNHFNERGEPSKANEVRAEAKKVMTATINDFTDNFTHYPVHYFMDTNLTLVKEGKLDGILFDNKYRVFESSPVRANDNSLSIVYYGTPPVELATNGHLSDEKGTYRDVRYPGNGIVILYTDPKTNEKFQEAYYAYVRIGNTIIKKRPKYSYLSSLYEMGYREMATQLQRKLSNRSFSIMELGR